MLLLSVQHVADDYAQRLDRSRVKVEALVSSALSRLAFGGNGGRQQQGRIGLEDGERDEDAGLPQLRQCRLANISTCDATMEVLVYGCDADGFSVKGEVFCDACAVPVCRRTNIFTSLSLTIYTVAHIR